MLEIQCLVRADGRPTLLGESIYDSGLTQQGVKVSWSNSSTESTLYLEENSYPVWAALVAPASVGEGTCRGA